MSGSWPDAPGLRLHHIGIVVPDIARTCTEYVERLGYTKRTGVIHDPVQTAYVQFLQLEGESALVELVSPDGPQSRLGNALSKGGGLNHLCYTARDIDATCVALRQRGFVVVHAPVPAVAFDGRRIAWLMGNDRVLTELVERAPASADHAL